MQHGGTKTVVVVRADPPIATLQGTVLFTLALGSSTVLSITPVDPLDPSHVVVGVLKQGAFRCAYSFRHLEHFPDTARHSVHTTRAAHCALRQRASQHNGAKGFAEGVRINAPALAAESTRALTIFDQAANKSCNMSRLLRKAVSFFCKIPMP